MRDNEERARLCRVKRGAPRKAFANAPHAKCRELQKNAQARALQGPGLVPAAISEPGY